MRFFAVNRTGVPVHIRLDESGAAPRTFLLTLSNSRISGGRPLARYVLVTKTPLHITYLDDGAAYVLEDKLGMKIAEGVDREGDYILSLEDFLQ
ncbi:MAG: hypothetical protein RL272_451 [Candidatus Parcubacteria bacterium]|jgi:hypothetical protein